MYLLFVRLQGRFVLLLLHDMLFVRLLLSLSSEILQYRTGYKTKSDENACRVDGLCVYQTISYRLPELLSWFYFFSCPNPGSDYFRLRFEKYFTFSLQYLTLVIENVN